MEKPEHSNSYSHILKYTGLYGGIQGVNILIGLIRNKLVAMLLGPEGMGLISLFNTSIRLVSDSTNFGISMSGVKEISEAYGRGDAAKVSQSVAVVRYWCLLTALLGMVVCVVMSPLLNRWTFDWGDHTLHFVLLSPIVALGAVSGGELAILKGTRQLRSLAVVSVYNVLINLIISVPLFYYWRETAIVPSMILLALTQLLTVLVYSHRHYPLRLSWDRALFGEGLCMVRLGMAFVLAGIMVSSAEFVIRSYLNTAGGLDVVGFYNVGYLMTLAYAGMVLSSLETDYFPRLSAVSETGPHLNDTVNRQIEVTLLSMAVLLPVFMISLPILLPLLYSKAFLPVVGMMKLTLLAMYVRAIMVPIEYLSLSRGDSLSYLFLEAVYAVVLVVSVLLGYRFWGLLGTGAAIIVTGIVGLAVDLVYMYYRYSYVLSAQVRRYAMVQISLGVLVYFVSVVTDGWIYWTAGLLLSALSALLSLRILRTKTHLWNSITRKICGKLHQK